MVYVICTVFHKKINEICTYQCGHVFVYFVFDEVLFDLGLVYILVLYGYYEI